MLELGPRSQPVCSLMSAQCKPIASLGFVMCGLETSSPDSLIEQSIQRRILQVGSGQRTPTQKSVYDRKTEWCKELVAWPPELPDLNPVELIWGNMKNYIRRQSVRRVDDLKAAILRC
ncbi:hypothetical protein GCK32_015464 [Trichostrongylus colubriformis]|uniref:Tc1-like transposase DDE domain-containing protein n=1 Tax=Trichostrongylus colubriformis TaxID=6319 RepID=A0AAN8IBX8_TRICO